MEWVAFARIEPFGGDVDDYRAGIAAAMRLNSHLREGADPVNPLDLFPWSEKPKAAPESPEAVANKVIDLFRVAGNAKD